MTLAQREPASEPEPDLPPLPKESWLQLPQETPRQYLAFTCYRDIEDEHRSIRAAYFRYMEKQGKPTPRKDASATFYIWSKKNRWLERAIAFDHEIERQEIQSLRRRRLRNARKRADALDEAMDILTLPSAVALTKADDMAEQLAKLPAADLVKLVRHAIGMFPDLLKAEKELLDPDGTGNQAPLALPPVDALRAAFQDREALAVLERVTVLAHGKQPAPIKVANLADPPADTDD